MVGNISQASFHSSDGLASPISFLIDCDTSLVRNITYCTITPSAYRRCCICPAIKYHHGWSVEIFGGSNMLTVGSEPRRFLTTAARTCAPTCQLSADQPLNCSSLPADSQSLPLVAVLANMC